MQFNTAMLINAYSEAPTLALAKLLSENIIELSALKEFASLDKRLIAKVLNCCDEMAPEDAKIIYHNLVNNQKISVHEFLNYVKTNDQIVLNEVVGPDNGGSSQAPLNSDVLEKLKSVVNHQKSKIDELEKKIQRIETALTSAQAQHDTKFDFLDSQINGLESMTKQVQETLRRQSSSYSVNSSRTDSSSFSVDEIPKMINAEIQNVVKVFNGRMNAIEGKLNVCTSPTSPRTDDSRSNTNSNQPADMDEKIHFIQNQVNDLSAVIQENIISRRSDDSSPDEKISQALDQYSKLQLAFDKLQKKIDTAVNRKIEDLSLKHVMLMKSFESLNNTMSQTYLSKDTFRSEIEKIRREMNNHPDNYRNNYYSAQNGPSCKMNQNHRENNNFLNDDIFDCARNGDPEAAEQILKHNPSMANVKNSSDRSPLFIAAKYNHIGVCKVLLKYGARVDETNEEDRLTALHWPSQKGYFDICKLLTDYNADVNALANSEWTPFTCSIAYNHIPIVKLYILKGAHVNMRKSIGTPLEIARKHKYAEIEEILRSNGAQR